MTSVKITDLTAYTDAASTDVLPIVDVGADVTKKIAIGDIVKAVPQGTAALPGLAFDSDPNTGVYSPGADQVAISTNGTGRLFVDSSGRVGLGTSIPAVPFDLKTTSSATYSTTTAADNAIAIYNDSNTTGAFGSLKILTRNANNTAGSVHLVGLSTSTNYASDFAIQQRTTAGAYRENLRITHDGKVGIGTTSPGYLLHLSQLSPGTTVASRIENTSTAADSDAALDLKTPNAVYTLKAKRSGTRCDFEVDGSPKLSIDSSGRLLVSTSSSRQVNASIAALQLQIEGTTYQSSSMSLVTNQNAADGSYIVLGKSRGTSLNSSTIVNSGDSLGAFWFCGADGYTMPRGAIIEAQVDGTPGANDMPGRLVFSTTADGASSPTERMRIHNNGDITIAKTAQDYTTAGAWIQSTGIINSAASGLDFWNSYNTAAGAYRFWVSSTGTVNATSTTISAISDIRFKENITDIDRGLAEILALKPRKFDWKDGKGRDIKNDRGFIAQEFEKVFPDLIDEWKDPAPEGEEPYKSVRQDLIPVLVKAIQEQQAMIIELQTKVAALEGV